MQIIAAFQISKESANQYGNRKCYLPNCEATIQGIDVTEPLHELVDVTGAE